jgi:hypothetical protein
VTKIPRPILHGRDHEHGGADPVGIVWENVSGTVAGVNDAVIDVTWTYLGGIFGLDTTIPLTLADGTTVGWWHSGGSGTYMGCGLEGAWQIDVNGTVTHASTTAPTVVRFGVNSVTTDIFSVNMADGASQPLSYSTSAAFSVDDQIALTVTHAIASGTPSSTLTGTMVFTLL